MRFLDLDLDFFVHGAAHMQPYDGPRLDADEYPPWSVEDALSFLEKRCGLRGKLPGFAVEHHGEVFDRWRTAMENGDLDAPFHVTHVDAHADLGMGDAAYVYIMSELLWYPLDARTNPIRGGRSGLSDGNFLSFAVACRWISDMIYVFNDGGGSDVPESAMEDFATSSGHLQLKRIDPEDVRQLTGGRRPPIIELEPRVPFRQVRYEAFIADEAFDMVSIGRSPAYTPEACDEIYDEIRRRYIEER